MDILNKPKCNKVFVAEGCRDLPAYVEGVFIQTYWKPSFFERLCLIFGSNLTVTIMGDAPQPIHLQADFQDIFK